MYCRLYEIYILPYKATIAILRHWVMLCLLASEVPAWCHKTQDKAEGLGFGV